VPSTETAFTEAACVAKAAVGRRRMIIVAAETKSKAYRRPNVRVAIRHVRRIGVIVRVSVWVCIRIRICRCGRYCRNDRRHAHPNPNMHSRMSLRRGKRQCTRQNQGANANLFQHLFNLQLIGQRSPSPELQIIVNSCRESLLYRYEIPYSRAGVSARLWFRRLRGSQKIPREEPRKNP
jgi:hypothetical protein